MELGILSLGDLQRDQRTGRRHRPVDRMAEILGYAVLADQLGLDVFAVGEHHSAEFFTSSPAVVLAAAAARTARIRLTSATTLLGVADPVRVYEDFASLDVISRGRAEVIVGRSAFAEPFALFGYDTADYDALFAEKARPAAGHPRRADRDLVGPVPPAAGGRRGGAAGGAGSAAGLGRRRRVARQRRTRRTAGPADGAGLHRRHAGAPAAAGGRLPGSRGTGRAR